LPIDVGPIREAEFPVSSEFLYFNHAAVSPIPSCSAEAGIRMLRRSRDEGAWQIRKWEELAGETRARFARIIGASPEEVAFVKNTSEGLSFVAAGFPWREGDNLVTSNVEYPSNIYPWMRLRSRNVELRMVAAKEGRVRKEDLFAACDGKTRMIALSSVEFVNGYRTDLSGIGEYCQKHGIFFCVDGIQSVGVLPMDVKSFGIDALSADGHKWLLSPEGIGGFYISRDVMEMVEPVILGWHSVKNRFDFENYDFRLSPDARRFEPGSHNTVGMAAFNASMELLLSIGMDRIWERVRRLTERILEKAGENGFEVLSPPHPEERSGIVTFRVPGADNGALWKAMHNRKAICSPRGGGIRVSPHFYNTPEEIDRFFDILFEERSRLERDRT
jgi:selenocysteine lyase/cysteine desulfurase